MSKLTFYDRQRIEFYLGLKPISLRDIAKFINRDVSVISREIKRHKPQFSPYNAELAQKAADRKAKLTNKKKLDKSEILKSYIEKQLREDWSPEQISGRIKEHAPPELEYASVKQISAETIYQHIYNQEEGQPRLYKHLRTHRKKRIEQGKRKYRGISIPDRTSINERPELVSTKERFGDMEADLLCGKRQKEAISVHYERKSMFVSLEKVYSMEAPENLKALKETIESFPEDFVKTMTFDNGGENAEHTKLKADYDIKTYFCDPGKAWQKGGVENMNKNLRQYIPKGFDIKKIEPEYLDFVKKRLNNRPRKTHNYLTPNEILSNYLKVRSL
jgi:IS30 family transposase